MNERMIQEVCFDKNLDLRGEYYYFKEGNIIDISKNDEYINLKDGEKISQNEFNDLKQYSMTLYLEEQIDIKEIQEENQAQINNINFFSGEQLPEVRKTHYEGQDEGAYGYGGISNISTYLKDRYGGSPTYVSGKMLTMDNFLMSDLENNVNNCSLTAITRIARYYYTKGYTNIPANKNTIYKKVVSIAKGYGYTSDGGTFPTKINNIAQDLFRAYSYKSSSSNGIYVWTFNGQVKSEVDSNYPVIMNIARGYYGDHSVTVCGYKIYKIGSKTHNFIAVYDGWVNAVRYIDYEAFANDLITSGFGSFNTIRVK